MIDKMTRLFQEFFLSEKAGGLLLLFATIISLTLANSGFGEGYLAFWNHKFLGYSLLFWINDGLMAVFFLLVGLEIEREIFVGELSDLRNSMLPVFAALGGMVVPAGIYLGFNLGTPDAGGFGIPMATDIAFSLGILALLGSRVPLSLKVFLTALAIIDDLGAILVIAFAYSKGLQFQYVLMAGGLIGGMLIMRRLGWNHLALYLIPGLGLWHFIHEAGIHSTIAGVILAFLVPFRKNDENCPSLRLQHYLHKPVAFFVIPLFALANTGISLSGEMFGALREPMAAGIMAGLLIGKPVGIFLFSYIGVKLGLARLFPKLTWANVLALGLLAGIGFTMSIFITTLAFSSEEKINLTKLAIFMASAVAAILGFSMLRFQLREPKN
jgi:NhaA family Na+:H+ antiporter